MDTLMQDLRFALRSLRKHRGTTMVAVLCLALGMGANTAIYSVVRAVLLDSLPYSAPQNLFAITATYVSDGVRGTNGGVSPDNFGDWRAQSRAFSDMAAYRIASVDLAGGSGTAGEPERLRGVLATVNLFSLLGARPLVGRAFIPSDDAPNATPVAVISEALWRRRFASSRGIIGSPIRLGDTQFTVVGVMPARFDFPIASERTDVWRVYTTAALSRVHGRTANFLRVVGRLASNADSASAAANLARITQGIAQEYPESQKNRGALAVPLTSTVVGGLRPALFALLGAAGLVLLIACGNVASLLLARASSRRREVAIRSALGASRGRLVRQLITEGVVLSLAGAALGLLVARLGLRALVQLASSSLPRADAVRLDGRVLLAVLLVSVVTGLVFGLVPAVRASRADMRDDLSSATGRSGTSRSHHRTLDALSAAQIALSFVLLVGAGLLIRTLASLMSVDPGFRTEHVLAFHAATPSAIRSDSGLYDEFYARVLAQLRALPGVRGAAFTDLLPIQDPQTDRFFSVVGRAPTSLDQRPDAQIRTVSADYFRTLGIRVTAGREFDAHDVPGSQRVALINDELARRFFPGERPVGQRLDPDDGGPPATIIGVVKSVRERGLDEDTRAEFYLDARQDWRSLGAATFVLSTNGAPESYAAAVRSVMHAIAPQQPVYDVATMRSIIAESLAKRRLTLVLLSVFAALALSLSAAGVYGVMSYGVSQRTREIGIRMALGARGGDVSRMVLGDSARLVGVGLVSGAAAAALLTRLIQSMLYDVPARDLATFGSVTLIIVLAAAGATVLPARRAAHVDPLTATRAE
jgi:putative ABC transport system permease protein